MSSGRPSGGYKNAAGKRVPGVTTILSRFKESGGLIQWAWQCGRDGLDLNEVRDKAADAGTCCHDMVWAHLHGQPFDRGGYDPAALKSAEHAFLAFLEWAEQSTLKLTATEVSLVSEQYQFGGTFDAAMISKSLRLVDWKTSGGIYADMLIQVAGGYSLLWQEHNPGQPLAGVDIVRFSKPESPDDPVTFEHRHWSAEVIPICQKQFLLLREAYDQDKRIKGLL